MYNRSKRQQRHEYLTLLMYGEDNITAVNANFEHIWKRKYVYLCGMQSNRSKFERNFQILIDMCAKARKGV